MKIQHFLLTCLFALPLAAGEGQPVATQLTPDKPTAPESRPPALATFDLDFPGGNPHPAATVTRPVTTTQIAPTILTYLRLNPHKLQAVRREHTTALPTGG